MDLLQSDTNLASLPSLQPLTPTSLPPSPAVPSFMSDSPRPAVKVSNVLEQSAQSVQKSVKLDILEPNATQTNAPLSLVLPLPIWDQVAQYLSVRDLCQLCQVSKLLQHVAYNDLLWSWRLDNVNADRLVERASDSDRFLITSDINPLNAFDEFTYPKGNPRLGVVKLFRIVGNFYYDIVNRPTVHYEPVLFQAYRDPVEQARLLSQLKRFSSIDPLEDNHEENVSKLLSTIEIFENAALAEFEQAIADKKYDLAQKFAKVIIVTTGGDSCVQLFIDNAVSSLEGFFGPIDSFITDGKLDHSLLQTKLTALASKLNDLAKTVDLVYPLDLPVTLVLFEKVVEGVIMEFTANLIEAIYESSTALYLKSVPEIYSRLLALCNSLEPCQNAGPDYCRNAKSIIDDHYSLQTNSYLNEELRVFTDSAERQVGAWTDNIRNEEQATESFLWSNVSSKEQDKTDFLTSFKKVLFMPVTAMSKDFTREKPSSSSSTADPRAQLASTSLGPAGLSSTTSVNSLNSNTGSRVVSRTTPAIPPLPPRTEFDAVVAVMNSKLEGIKTLFSLELAINLLTEAKNAMERIQCFVAINGDISKTAKNQCESLFVELVNTLGGEHIKGGFDMAIERLENYDPRQHRQLVSGEESGQERDAVEPLAIFAELVNIGDLIQQMMHTFFEEELATRKLVDRNDFLTPSVKAKKRFEQMLDECVANGLNRGIDVLIDQVDFTLITLQLGSDYNPLPVEIAGDFDIGPTNAAKKVVSLLSSHMWLLEGSTEKSIIDVFQQEVGLRFFHSICKHLKRQVISIDGAIKLISDINYYYDYVVSLRQRQIVPYFVALKEVGQLFLIDARDATALGQTLSDMSRFRGVFKPEEILEFVQRRQDWLLVKKDVERVLYGFGVDCIIM